MSVSEVCILIVIMQAGESNSHVVVHRFEERCTLLCFESLCVIVVAQLFMSVATQ